MASDTSRGDHIKTGETDVKQSVGYRGQSSTERVFKKTSESTDAYPHLHRLYEKSEARNERIAKFSLSSVRYLLNVCFSRFDMVTPYMSFLAFLVQFPKTCCAMGAKVPGLSQDEERFLLHNRSPDLALGVFYDFPKYSKE